MIFRERKRLAALAKAEAQGRSFWTDKMDSAVRYKIVYAMEDEYEGGSQRVFDPGDPLYDEVRGVMIRQLGGATLSGTDYDARRDVLGSVLKSDVDIVASVIEVFHDRLRARASASSYTADFGVLARRRAAPGRFTEVVNQAFLNHRVSFELINGRMTTLDSQAMHSNVVVPTLVLLAARKDLAAVEAAYRDALDELASNKPDDAITDAARALQEMLTLLGCTGNALGPLIKSARAKGLLAASDSRLTAAFKNIEEWVSADRSAFGDTHLRSPATLDDAQLTVHVTGALIVRLSKGARA